MASVHREQHYYKLGFQTLLALIVNPAAVMVTATIKSAHVIKAILDLYVNLVLKVRNYVLISNHTTVLMVC